MGKRLYRVLCLAAIAFWMGGFTFYALVVIPIGSRMLGSVEQGMITQRVTHWMNLSGVLTLCILLPGVRRKPMIMGSWVVMAVVLVALYWLHPRLDALIDNSAHALSDGLRFYRWHQLYLATVTLQWCAAVVHLWGLAGESTAIPANG